MSAPPGRGARTADGHGEGTASRAAALEVLARVESDGAYANLVIGPVLQRGSLDERDRALVTDLAYGTIRNRRALAHLVDRFLSDKPPPPAYRALLLGAYQLTHRPDIPHYAAVSATVSVAPKRFRGLVNAVLRRVADAEPSYPDDATRLSYPDWILEALRRDLGDDTAIAALESMNEPAEVHTRTDGYVQDPASQMVAEVVAGLLPADSRIVDLCAAPGGKATAMSRAPGAWVAAADVSAKRAGLVAGNVGAVSAPDVSVVVSDATVPAFRPGAADAVLLDAPCSGLGVLRRRPDARWRITADAPDRLATLQRQMVDASVPLVAPGGLFAYSVCTLTAQETIGVDEHIRSAHPQLEPLHSLGEPWRDWGRGSILLPQAAGTDGMALFLYRTAVNT